MIDLPGCYCSFGAALEYIWERDQILSPISLYLHGFAIDSPRVPYAVWNQNDSSATGGVGDLTYRDIVSGAVKAYVPPEISWSVERQLRIIFSTLRKVSTNGGDLLSSKIFRGGTTTVAGGIHLVTMPVSLTFIEYRGPERLRKTV